jgi:ABC-type transport system involved in multi-copper enzyme maturation permease subunit
MRWGVGPVFLYECLANSRRWQTYAIRSCGVAALLLAMGTIAWSHTATVEQNSWREYARLGQSYFYAMIGVELALVMLTAPAATAGAICMDRSRGTLAHMLATDLSDPEIVLGKLAARLLPVLGLVACSWPVLAISSLLGGIDPTALTIAFAIILAVALLGCTMALALSVWARKPHEVVLVTYTFWMLDLLLWPIWFAMSRAGWMNPPLWTLVANPFYLAFAPYADPNKLGFADYLGFFLVTLGASCLLTVLAIRRMRPVAVRTTGDRRKEPGLGRLGRLIRWLPGPRLDGNPVLWREWHRSRPSPWMLGLLVLVGGTTTIACVIGAVTFWVEGVDPGSRNPGGSAGVFGYILQVLFGLLMLSVVAPMSMSEERQRGSLDLLATTTLSTRTIVIGKWLGTFRLVPMLAIGPGLVGLAMATGDKKPPVGPTLPPFNTAGVFSSGTLLYCAALLVVTILVHGALLTSLGLALATWIPRQSRAIAISVCLFVTLAIGWPILAEASRRSNNALGFACLSPIMAAGGSADVLTIRASWFRAVPWWTTFWDVEVGVLAVGLLWLTVRTFDGCFGRIPERPRRTPLLTDFIIVLAGILGAGGLVGAIVIWFLGILPRSDPFEMSAGAWSSAVLVVIGLLLLYAVGVMSISGLSAPPLLGMKSARRDSARRFVLGRWGAIFRLVLLLAIGPVLIALALATAYRVVLPPPQIVALAKGAKGVVTYDRWGDQVSVQQFPPTPRNATGISAPATQAAKADPAEEAVARIMAERALAFQEPALGERLSIATIVIFTILAHGAVMTSLGLALGARIRRRGRAITAGVVVFAVMVVAWPFIALIPGVRTHAQGLILLSPLLAIGMLLNHLSLSPDELANVLTWIRVWDLALIVAAISLLWSTIRKVDLGFRRMPQKVDDIMPDSVSEPPARDAVLVGH